MMKILAHLNFMMVFYFFVCFVFCPLPYVTCITTNSNSHFKTNGIGSGISNGNGNGGVNTYDGGGHASTNVIDAHTKNQLSSFTYNNYTWVLTPNLMNHYQACHQIKLLPTSPDQIIPWSYNIMKDVVAGLKLSLVNTSQGIAGCCVPGLWCSNTECFTQSMQTNFINYHSNHPINLYTVYTCLQDPLLETVFVEAVTVQEEGKIVVSGDNFGNQESNIVSVLGTSPITNIETCNSICQNCLTTPCAKDNACVLVDETYSCFMFCSGVADNSCPCGTTCQHVNVYTSRTSYVATYFCAPKSLQCDNYPPSEINQFHGMSPRIYNWINDTDLPSTISNIFDVTVSVSESNVGDLPVEIVMQSCDSSSQCNDHSPFTHETCQNGKCSYTKLTTIPGSTFPAIHERSTSFSYLKFVAKNMETEHDIFESRVRLDGELLEAVSDADDLPQAYVSLGFTFTYFGNQISSLAINANGVISLPPFPNCQALAGTLYCPIYGTGTNTIAIWGSDWDLRVGGESSTIHILNQSLSGENFQEIYGINANAFHILYSAIYKFEQGSSRSSSSEPSTFSMSMYQDGSIRLRYHSLLSRQIATDVFGVWGSRTTTEDELLGPRYHEEIVDPEYRTSGHDVTFCYISTIVCGDKAVAISGRVVNLTMIGKAPSCLALGESLQTKCTWLGQGSIYQTIPSFHVVDSIVTLSCPVPNLHLEDNSLISLDLTYEAIQSTLVSSLENAQKSLIAKVYDQISGQLSTTHVMFRYFNLPNTAADSGIDQYGCNPLIPGDTTTTPTCDLCGVCNGNNTSLDCNGDCFGSAYIDNCRVCAGGATGIYPDSTCDLTDPLNRWNSGDVLDTLSKTILLLTMMICMTFIFSACMRIIRASFIGPEEEQNDGFFGIALPHVPNRRENGLNNFEIDALGQIVFAKGVKDISNDPSNDIESSPSSSVITIPLQPNLECSICLIEFIESDHCRQLPCDHIFHTQCIDQWFTVSVVCPMCKRNIRALLHGEEDLVPRQPQPQHLQHQQQQQTSGSSEQQLQQNHPPQHIEPPIDFLTSRSPASQTIEMTDFSSNSSYSSSNSSVNTHTHGDQEPESVALINPFT